MTEKLSREHNNISTSQYRLEQELKVPISFGNERIMPGELCPKCKSVLIDYDGLLNLMCPLCGLVEIGCFT